MSGFVFSLFWGGRGLSQARKVSNRQHEAIRVGRYLFINSETWGDVVYGGSLKVNSHYVRTWYIQSGLWVWQFCARWLVCKPCLIYQPLFCVFFYPFAMHSCAIFLTMNTKFLIFHFFVLVGSQWNWFQTHHWAQYCHTGIQANFEILSKLSKVRWMKSLKKVFYLDLFLWKYVSKC